MRAQPVIVMIGCLVVVATACGGQRAVGSDSVTASSTATTTTTTTTPSTTTAAATTSSTTSSTTATSTTTTSTTTTSSTTTSSTSTTSTVAPLPDPEMSNTNQAFERLAATNPAATMTVVRDGRSIASRASGSTIDGAPATSDTPMVVASVSKVLTGLMIARLHEAGSIDVDEPVPWSAIVAATHPGWLDVTPRELLNHTSGMPVVRQAWFEGDLDCVTFLATLLERQPTGTRSRWTYSNGNYCALGLLSQHASGLPLDQAAHAILFEPIGASGAHLTTGGQLPGDVEYSLGVPRLSRLGGAGSFIVSTDDVAFTLASVTATDLGLLRWPGVFVDQYGWGHTGSVRNAVSCAWVLEAGRTAVAVTVAGGSPATGGDLCDRIVPAVADDLGIGQGPPDRSPP